MQDAPARQRPRLEAPGGPARSPGPAPPPCRPFWSSRPGRGFRTPGGCGRFHRPRNGVHIPFRERCVWCVCVCLFDGRTQGAPVLRRLKCCNGSPMSKSKGKRPLAPLCDIRVLILNSPVEMVNAMMLACLEAHVPRNALGLFRAVRNKRCVSLFSLLCSALSCGSGTQLILWASTSMKQSWRRSAPEFDILRTCS